MKERKPTLISPSTPNTRDTMSSGKWLLNTLTAIVHSDSINTHNKSEPSCPPHTPATRYSSGSAEFELDATYSTEKSFCTNAYVRQPKAIATNTACPCAAGRASFIHDARPRCAPTSGSVPCTTAMISARTSAKFPSSGIIWVLPWCYFVLTMVLVAFWLVDCAFFTASAASGGM